MLRKFLFILFFLLFISFCIKKFLFKEFIATKYTDDLKKYTFLQYILSPSQKEFIGVFHDESGSLSGNNLIKIYSPDSMSYDELYYGAHPLEITSWTDSAIIIKASVYSVHGDSAYRK